MLRPLAVSFCIVFVLAALAVPAAPVATGSPTAPGVSSASALSSAVGVADGGARDLPDLPAAPSTASWFDGMTQYSTVVNCASMIQGFPYYEKGIGTYVGSAADPEAGQPRPGTLYYLHIVLAGLGNPCFGTRAYVDFNLPANTSLAISPGVKLQCWRLPASGGGWIDFTNTADCPQTLPAATLNNGARVIPSTDYANGQTWPLAQGAMLEFRIPVISSQPMLSENFRANVWALDGNSSPWLRPQASVFVFDTSGSGAPRFVFDSPSYITLTATTAYNYGYLYFYGVNSGGNVYAQLYDAGQTTLLLDYALGAIPTSGYAFTAWVYWINLQPNTTYSWRFRFERNGGGAYTSDFQTFTTLPDAQVKIGDGTPAPCTDAALGNALAGGAKRVIFDCGPLPITITVSTLRFINGGVTIDGGNKVTLSGNNTTNHFGVSNYSTLTLTNIALVNGYSNFACGSVVVQGFAKLVADEARFLNNHTTGWGGALCIQPFGSAQIYRSQLAGNSAGNLGGGAIFNDGSLTVYWSDISGNTAAGNGGGIYNEGSALMNFSALIGNVATHPISPTAGGGLYNTVNPYDSNTGYFDIAASTIGANWAKYGGGVSTNGSAMSFTAVTIAGNVADPGGIGAQLVGGGIESTNLASSVILVNTLLAGNGPGNCSVLVYAKIFSSAGHNLDDGSRCGFAGAGDLSNANPRLGSLQLNGGRTRTYGFIGNSAAVDAGDNANCGFTDQRGYSGAGGWRQVDGNGDGVAACDIGAFEFRPGLDLLGRSYLPLIRR